MGGHGRMDLCDHDAMNHSLRLTSLGGRPGESPMFPEAKAPTQQQGSAAPCAQARWRAGRPEWLLFLGFEGRRVASRWLECDLVMAASCCSPAQGPFPMAGVCGRTNQPWFPGDRVKCTCA